MYPLARACREFAPALPTVPGPFRRLVEGWPAGPGKGAWPLWEVGWGFRAGAARHVAEVPGPFVRVVEGSRGGRRPTLGKVPGPFRRVVEGLGSAVRLSREGSAEGDEEGAEGEEGEV